MSQRAGRDDERRLWVDVGAFLVQPRPLTGIQRATVGIVTSWLNDPRLPLRLCAYDRRRGYFREIDERQWRDASAPDDVITVPRARPTPVPQPPVSPHPKIGLLKSLKDAVLSGVRSTLWQCLRLGWRSLRGVAGLAGLRWLFEDPDAVPLGELYGPTDTIPDFGAPADFKPGDMLFLITGAWDDLGAPAAIRKARAQAQLQVVQLIYDLIPLNMPRFFPRELTLRFKRWFEGLASAADVWLTISKKTRSDMLKQLARLGQFSGAVEAIRLGDYLPSAFEPRPPLDGVPAGPFALCVSSIEPRKNHQLLYRVWRRLAAKHGDRTLPLLMVGHSGWMTDDLVAQIKSDRELRGKITLLREVADPELVWLYRNCRFTLYPSHYEGWGLPVAESLVNAKYCIASSSSSIPEIGGALIDYHDPADVAGCLRLVERAMFEAGFVEMRNEQIAEQFRGRSWEDCAAQVLDALGRHGDFELLRTCARAEFEATNRRSSVTPTEREVSYLTRVPLQAPPPRHAAP